MKKKKNGNVSIFSVLFGLLYYFLPVFFNFSANGFVFTPYGLSSLFSSLFSSLSLFPSGSSSPPLSSPLSGSPFGSPSGSRFRRAYSSRFFTSSSSFLRRSISSLTPGGYNKNSSGVSSKFGYFYSSSRFLNASILASLSNSSMCYSKFSEVIPYYSNSSKLA